MTGFVSHEKEKFEKMAREMQSKERDLVYMDSKLRKVEELIKNSPVVQSRRVALKETATQNTATSDEKVIYGQIRTHPLSSAFYCLSQASSLYMYFVTMHSQYLMSVHGKQDRAKQLMQFLHLLLHRLVMYHL